MTGSLLMWQRLEAAFMACALLVLYQRLGASWWQFAALILVPDLSMLGYLFGPRIGAVTYNIAHAYIGPALLVGISAALSHFYLQDRAFDELSQLAIIWAAHIAFDRMLGYGLKSPEGFKITHLGLIGKADTTS